MLSFWRDLHFGFWLLVKAPAYALSAIMTLAIGVGLNTSVFSLLVASGHLRLPIKHQASVAILLATNPSIGIERGRISPSEFLDWKEQNKAFESLAALSPGSHTLSSEGGLQEVSLTQVSRDFFHLLGVQPLLGNGFPLDETINQSGSVIVLSHRLWHITFLSDPNVIGRSIEIDDRPFVVVGVMAPDFWFLGQTTDGWIPSDLRQNAQDRTHRSLQVIGRLRQGVTMEAAQSEMTTIAHQQALAFAVTNKGWGVRVLPLNEELSKQTGLGLAVLFAPAVLVYLLACGNLANMVLARGVMRTKEFAIRAALGASRVRLMRQFAIENLWISLGGSLAGYLLAYCGIAALRFFLSSFRPELAQGIHADYQTLLVALLAGSVALVFFSLIPSIRISQSDLNQELKEGGKRRVSFIKGHRLSDLFVISEVCMALTLLVLTGLLSRMLISLDGQRKINFNAQNLLIVKLTSHQASSLSTSKIPPFDHAGLSKLAAVTGVQAAGAAGCVPAACGGTIPSDRVTTEEKAQASVTITPISPGYLNALGAKLVDGRDLSWDDTAGAPQVAIISQTAARSLWGQQNPLARRFRLDDSRDNSAWISVVGVVADLMVSSDPRSPTIPFVYVPYAQRQEHASFIISRTEPRSTLELSRMKRELLSLTKGQYILHFQSMTDSLSQSLAEFHFTLGLFVGFTGLALALAIIGVHAIISHFVQERMQEIGIRLAMGAQCKDILIYILTKALSIVGAGLLIGLMFSLFLTRLVSHELVGVSSTDPTTYVICIIVLLFISTMACVAPLRRALSVQPTEVLRCE